MQIHQFFFRNAKEINIKTLADAKHRKLPEQHLQRAQARL